MGLICRNRTKGLDSFWLFFVGRALARQGFWFGVIGLLTADLFFVDTISPNQPQVFI